jgi:hypothetical protein
MGYNKALYFMLEMTFEHNENSLNEDMLSTDYMPTERLAEVRAAYDFVPAADSVASRVEVAEGLLDGTRGVWSAARLAVHRWVQGGRWRDLLAKRLASRPGKRTAAVAGLGEGAAGGE